MNELTQEQKEIIIADIDYIMSCVKPLHDPLSRELIEAALWDRRIEVERGELPE